SSDLRDAKTLAAVFSVLTGGRSLHDPTGESGGTPRPETDLSGFRVGIPRDALFMDCDSSVLEGLEAMSAALASLGADLVDARLPTANLAHDAGFQVIYPEALTVHSPHSQSWADYDAFTVERLSRGTGILASDYLRAKQVGVRLQQELLSALDTADALLIPTVAAGAPTIHDATMFINGREVPSFNYQSRLAMICSLTGFPGLTVPTGHDGSG